MGKLLLVVALVACAPVKQAHRWPDHRKQHDDQLEELQTRTHQLEASEHQLYERVEALERELAKLKSAVPSPGT
jgi:septal ring factor EnvC (AmiA/AmiB activator)